jgi:hypothetical protein
MGRNNLQVYGTDKVGWSCRFWPTPGRSETTGIPNLWSSFLGPTPDSWRILGVPNPPAVRITSLAAYTFEGVAVLSAVVGRYLTPMAFLPLNKTLATTLEVRRW